MVKIKPFAYLVETDGPKGLINALAIGQIVAKPP